MNIQTAILEYAQKLSALDFCPPSSVRILVQDGHTVYATPAGADLSALTEADITDVTGTTLLWKAALIRSRWNAMIVAEPRYTCLCFEECYEMPSVLDDMAQIAGLKVSWCEPDRPGLKAALRLSPVAVTQKGQALACGRTLYEAMNCLMILEKNAEVFMKSEILDYAPAVRAGDALLENAVYWGKYSRQEQKFRKSAESGVPETGEFSSAETASAESASALPETPEAVSTPEPPETAAESESEARRATRKEEILRDLLVTYGNKMLASGLVYGTWGNCSVRLDDEWMLCTPSGLDYSRLKPEDMVKVRLETLEYEGTQKPTSEKGFHAGLYLKRPEIGAVLHTHSKYACIFAACDTTLVLSNNEEITCAKYALSGTKRLSANVIRAVGDGIGCLMSHHGLVAVGRDLEEAYRRCYDIEESARSYIDDKWARRQK